jgi:hypothetical protein
MNGITHTQFDNRILATYSSFDRVFRAKTVLKTKLGLPESSLDLIKPKESDFEGKLEGSPRKIGINLLRTHLLSASVGLAIGMVIAFLLVEFGPAFTRNSPLFTYIAFISPGLFIGVFWAGLRGLKPEHDVINQDAVEARNNAYWTLVVETENVSISKADIVEEIKQTDCSEVTR